jgi:F-type H+-transporting ATPase subunit b
LGSELPCELRTDPALIAGIELHSRNAIVRNSWRGDLDRIRQELDREEHTHRS